jgi:hypothetical protein
VSSLLSPPWHRFLRSPASKDCTQQGADLAGAAAECLEGLALQCDKEPRCAAFSPNGKFWEVVDGPSCGVPGVADGIDASPLAGLYLKAPLSSVPMPRKLCYSDGRLQSLGALSDCSPANSWYMVRSTDVVDHDIYQVSAAGSAARASRAVAAAGSTLQAAFDACANTTACAGFNLPGGWLKSSVHPADTTFVRDGGTQLYSKIEIPPQDYVTMTVVSLLEEMGARGDVCGDAASPFGGRAHLYVFDTSSRTLHTKPSRPQELITPERGPQREDYWFSAFAWLRRRYGRLPCISFLPATSYTRLTERTVPARGMPDFHPDNKGRNLMRGIVQQTLDFVSALRYAAAASLRAHVLVWEDDCFACSSSVRDLHEAVLTVSRFDPSWGSLKIGNGGSGMLFHADIVANLLTYLQTRRGSDNIDVSMWRYLNSGGYSDYISKGTLSAHRGLQSSLRLSAGSQWGRVKCRGLLDRHWGWYKDCDLSRIVAAGDAQLRSEGASSGVAAFVKDWDCSVYSPATDGMVSQ